MNDNMYDEFFCEYKSYMKIRSNFFWNISQFNNVYVQYMHIRFFICKFNSILQHIK
jgi:uncharacterized protein YozE (UPF0346 family)